MPDSTLRPRLANTITLALEALHREYMNWFSVTVPPRMAAPPAFLFMMLVPQTAETVAGSAAAAIRRAVHKWAPSERSRGLDGGAVVKPDSQLLEAYVDLVPGGSWQYERAEWLVEQLLDLLSGDTETVSVRSVLAPLRLHLESEIQLDGETRIRQIRDGEAGEIARQFSAVNRRWNWSTEALACEITLRTKRGTRGAEHGMRRARRLARIMHGTALMTLRGHVRYAELDAGSTNPFGSLRPRRILCQETPRPIRSSPIHVGPDEVTNLQTAWGGIRRMVSTPGNYLRAPFYSFVDGAQSRTKADAFHAFVRGIEMLRVDDGKIGSASENPSLFERRPPNRMGRSRSSKEFLERIQNRGFSLLLSNQEMARYSLTARKVLQAMWLRHFNSHRGRRQPPAQTGSAGNV